MQPMEYATLSYRTGDRAGWYLSEQLIVGSDGRDLVALLDGLTKQGWKLTIVGATCQLARPRFSSALSTLGTVPRGR
jgi:hypothetical protein